eukprot:4442499-Prymnesium_polylepis.1
MGTHPRESSHHNLPSSDSSTEPLSRSRPHGRPVARLGPPRHVLALLECDERPEAHVDGPVRTLSLLFPAR